MNIYVVIATHRRDKLLARTLDSLGKCIIPENFVSVIIAENGSKSGTRDIVGNAAPMLHAQYVFCDEANKSMALNQALELIDDGYIIFTDDDARFDKDFLLEHSRAAAKFGEGHFFGGPFGADYDGFTPPDWIRSYLPYSAKGWSLSDVSDYKIITKPLFLGINWAAFKSDIMNSGKFDTAAGPGENTQSTGQEYKMQSLLLEKGLKGVYIPNAMAWHFVPEERCSPEWVLYRRQRAGRYWARNDTEQAVLKNFSGRLKLLKILLELLKNFISRPKLFNLEFKAAYFDGYINYINENRKK